MVEESKKNYSLWLNKLFHVFFLQQGKNVSSLLAQSASQLKHCTTLTFYCKHRGSKLIKILAVA